MKTRIHIYKSFNGWTFRYIGRLPFVASHPSYKEIYAAHVFVKYLNQKEDH